MEWSERHTLIMEQAAALFATKGIAGTKVRDIADGVGILSGSLYHYFPSKDAIAELIVTQYLDALVDEYKAILASSNGPRERLDDLVKASFRVSQAHPHASEIYQNNGTYLRKLQVAPQDPRCRAHHQGRVDDGDRIRHRVGRVPRGPAGRGAVRPHPRCRLVVVALVLAHAEFGMDHLADSVVSVFLEGIEARH